MSAIAKLPQCGRIDANMGNTSQNLAQEVGKSFVSTFRRPILTLHPQSERSTLSPASRSLAATP